MAVDFLPERVLHTALEMLAGRLAAGQLVALPQVVHKMGNVQQALRQMSQARWAELAKKIP